MLPCLAFARWWLTAFDDRAVSRAVWALDVCAEALVSGTPGGTRIPNLLIRSQIEAVTPGSFSCRFVGVIWDFASRWSRAIPTDYDPLRRVCGQSVVRPRR